MLVALAVHKLELGAVLSSPNPLLMQLGLQPDQGSRQ
jgi:hypothetical protein